MLWLVLLFLVIFSVVIEPVVLGIIALSILVGLIHPALGFVFFCIVTALLITYYRGKDESIP